MEAIRLVKRLNKLNSAINSVRVALHDDQRDAVCCAVQDHISKLVDALFLVGNPDDATLDLMDELDEAIDEINKELFPAGASRPASNEQITTVQRLLKLFETNFSVRLLSALKARADQGGDQLAEGLKNTLLVSNRDRPGADAAAVTIASTSDSDSESPYQSSSDELDRAAAAQQRAANSKQRGGGHGRRYSTLRSRSRTLENRHAKTNDARQLALQSPFGLHGTLQNVDNHPHGSSEFRLVRVARQLEHTSFNDDHVESTGPTWPWPTGDDSDAFEGVDLRDPSKCGSRAVPTVVVVHGPPGVGKTDAALHLCHVLNKKKENSLEYRCYVDLRKFQAELPSPKRWTEAVMRFLLSEGAQGYMTDGGLSGCSVGTSSSADRVKSLTLRYRDLFWNKRGLLLFDGVPSAQLLPGLLPRNGRSVVVVTTSTSAASGFPKRASNLIIHSMGPLTLASATRMLAHSLVEKEAAAAAGAGTAGDDAEPATHVKEAYHSLVVESGTLLPSLRCVLSLLRSFGPSATPAGLAHSIHLAPTLPWDSSPSEQIRRVFSFALAQVDEDCVSALNAVCEVLPAGARFTEQIWRAVASGEQHVNKRTLRRCVDAGLVDNTQSIASRVLMATGVGDSLADASDSEYESGDERAGKASVGGDDDAAGGGKKAGISWYAVHPLVRDFVLHAAKAKGSKTKAKLDKRMEAMVIEAARIRLVNCMASMLDRIEDLLEEAADDPDYSMRPMIAFDMHYTIARHAVELSLAHTSIPFAKGLAVLKPRRIFRLRLPSATRYRMYRSVAMSSDANKPVGLDLARVTLGLGDAMLELGLVTDALDAFHSANQTCQDDPLEESLANSPLHANALLRLGHARLAAEDPLEAVERFSQAKEIFEADENPVGVSGCLNLLAIAYRSVAGFHNALQYHEEGVALCEDVGYGRGLAVHLTNRAATFEAISAFDEALEAYKRAYSLWRGESDGPICVEGIAVCLLGQAICYERVGRFEDSVRVVQECEVVYAALGLPSGVADAMRLFGIVSERTHEYTKARNWYHAAASIFRFIGDVPSLAQLLNHEASMCCQIGEYDAALETAQRGLALQKRLQNAGGVCFCLTTLGHAFEQTGRWNFAVESYVEAIKFRRESGRGTDLGLLYSNLAAVYYSSGDLPRAVNAYRSAIMHIPVIRGAPAAELLCSTLFGLACLFHDVGHVDRALELLKRCQALQTKLAVGADASKGPDKPRGPVWAALPKVLEEVRQVRDSEELLMAMLRSALERHQLRTDRWSLALTSTVLGRAYLDAGDHDAAREMLMDARDLFVSLPEDTDNSLPADAKTNKRAAADLTEIEDPLLFDVLCWRRKVNESLSLACRVLGYTDEADEAEKQASTAAARRRATVSSRA